MPDPGLVAKKVANSLSITLSTATTAGNCLVVCIASYASSGYGTVSGITLGGSADHFGEIIRDDTTTGCNDFIWADPNCAGGQTALVISGSNLNVASMYGQVSVYEMSNLAATIAALKDKTSTDAATTGTAWTSGATATTAAAVEAWFGVGNTDGSLSTWPGSPWASDKQTYSVTGYQVTSSTGTAVYAGTCNDGQWSGAVATLKQTAGGATYTKTGGGISRLTGTGKPDRAVRNLSGGGCAVTAAIGSRVAVRSRAGAAVTRGAGSGSRQRAALVKAGGGAVLGLGSGRVDRAVRNLRAGGAAVSAGNADKVLAPAGGEPGWTHAEYLNGTSQETNFATATPPQAVWYGDDFGSFDFSDLPPDATVMGLSVTLRVRESGTANVRYRAGPYLSGVPLATIQDTGDQAGDTGLHFLTFGAWDTLPTAAQLRDPGFTIRCEFTRTDTTAVTSELCWIGVTANIKVPSATKSGGAAATGAGTGRRQGPVRNVAGGAAARGAGTGFTSRVRNLRGGGMARGAGTGRAAPVVLPRLVNKTIANPTSSTSLSITIPATTAHNCLIVCVSSYNTSATATVSGMTLGGSADHFAELAEDNATTPTRTFTWADPDCSGGQTALVISGSNLDCSSSNGMVTVYEFSNLAADIARLADQTDTSSGTGTSWSSGTTPATSDAVEVWVGSGNTEAMLSTTPGSPWINDAQSYTVNGYQIRSSTGTAVYAGTCGSGTWTAAVVTLRQPLGTVTHAVTGGGVARGMGGGGQAVVSLLKAGGGCAVAAGTGAAVTARVYAKRGAAAASGMGGGARQVAGLVKGGGGTARTLGAGRWAGPRTRAGGAAARGLAGGVLTAPGGARIFARNGGGMAPGLGSASAYSTGWVRHIMADSLVLGDIELLGGGVASTNPACAGAVFRLLPGYDPGAPQPTTDFVSSLLLDGERPFGRRSSNRTIKLPIWIIATDRDNLAAAREHLESTVDQDLWIATWTRDRDPNDPLPLLIDCFRGEPTVVTSDLQWEQHLCMKITVTIPAMPYARSDKQLKLRFASPVPTGPPPPPSPVVIDNFETITASTCYQHTAHVVGPHSVCWDPDDDRVGDPGGQSSRFEYSGVLANSLDLTGMTSVSMYLGFGTRYYHHLPFHGRHQAVTVELTFTDTSGHSISMSRSHLRLPVSRQYSSPVFSKVTIPLDLDDPVFAYASLQGYSIKVSNHHWHHDHHLRWVTLYLDALTAYPDSQTATPVTKAGFYTLYGVQGTARTAMSLELQQPPSASTATTVNSTGGGNYVVPVGTAWLKVAVLGGGGAGGGRTSSGMGGGGGGAEYAREDLFPVVEGETIPYKVGAGGTAGASPVNGGDTYFGPGSASSLVVTAHGGLSAAQDSITGAAGGGGSANTVAHPGGAGRTASGIYGGGGGSSGGTDLPGNTPLGVAATSFTATGTTTWTCPVGVTQVYAETWGAGASGATGDGNDGGGGGGGEYAAGYVNVTPGNGYTVVVGTGGAAVGPGINLNGLDGGNSSFTGNAGAQILAHGGIKGISTWYSGGGGAGGSGSTNAVHHSGGQGGSAQPYSGGGGSSGSPSGNGNSGNGYGTPGSAPTDGGAGGAGSGQSQNNAYSGSAPGGGGGGTYGPHISGAGGNGRVRLTYPGGAPDQNGALAVAGGGAGGNGGATGNSAGSAGSQPGGGGGGANSAGTAEAGGVGGAGRIVITPYASQAWKSVILHRPPRGARKSVQPVVSVGNGADAPDGTHWYTMPQGVTGTNALFEGTYTVYLIASSWNGTGSRTVTATVRQVEYSGGPSYSVATAGVTFTPSQVTNGILCTGVLTLPVREIPPDNISAYFQVAVTDTNTSDRFWDCLFLDTMGQTVVINEPSSGYLRYFVDAPDANTALGRFMGSQSDRLAAVSVLQNTDALSGGPLTIEPADQDNTLLAYCPDGAAPAIGVSYFPAWYFDRTS